MQTERKHLDKTSLLSNLKTIFSVIPDPGKSDSKYSIADCLMSTCAIFGFKYPSLLQLETDLRNDAPLEHNLKSLYQITKIPSDTHLRTRLDEIDYKKLQAAFDISIIPLQRGKLLLDYQFLDEYYLVSIDGTGYFSSDSINCKNCCIKKSKPKCDIAVIWVDTDTKYSHHLLQWKLNNKKKDAILLLYHPIEAKWHMHIYDAEKETTSIQPIPELIKSELTALLSTIKSSKISSDIIQSIVDLLIKDETLFNGKSKAGQLSYYHHALSAVLVHPDKKQVFPLAVEPIIKPDGSTKNDCERNAAFRLLRTLKASHPHLKLVIVLDALYANGPLIKLLKELDFKFIITAKDMKHLFEEYHNNGNKQTVAKTVNNREELYQYSLDLPLNATHPDISVNLLEYTETTTTTNKKTNKAITKKFYSTWITDLPISKNNVIKLMKGARARWKIENETFNTLKNQGYNFGHNYGHGNNNLSTVFCYLMFITFLIDQIEQYVGYYFNKILAVVKYKTHIWRRLLAKVTNFTFDSWESLYLNVLAGFAHLSLNTT